MLHLFCVNLSSQKWITCNFLLCGYHHLLKWHLIIDRKTVEFHLSNYENSGSTTSMLPEMNSLYSYTYKVALFAIILMLQLYLKFRRKFKFISFPDTQSVLEQCGYFIHVKYRQRLRNTMQDFCHFEKESSALKIPPDSLLSIICLLSHTQEFSTVSNTAAIVLQIQPIVSGDKEKAK